MPHNHLSAALDDLDAQVELLGGHLNPCGQMMICTANTFQGDTGPSVIQERLCIASEGGEISNGGDQLLHQIGCTYC
jgi:hypothetical protein